MKLFAPVMVAVTMLVCSAAAMPQDNASVAEAKAASAYGGRTAVETVTPQRAKDGSWKVSGYFINQAQALSGHKYGRSTKTNYTCHAPRAIRQWIRADVHALQNIRLRRTINSPRFLRGIHHDRYR